MSAADRSGTLMKLAAVLDMVEAAAGTQEPDEDFQAAVGRLVDVLRTTEDMVAALYVISRLSAYSMARRAQVEGISFETVMMAARLEAMGGPGAE